MYSYSLLEWLLFLYIYCFIGWCWETAYVSIRRHKFVNRGFMHGPFLPIYGTGAIMMLVVSAPFQHNLILTYFAGMAGATALELVTGALMEALFKVRYWDYSNQKFNYKGYICLSSSVAWGFFTILMTRFMHKPVESFVLGLPERLLNWGTIILTCYIVVDFAVSFHGALNLRILLDKMDKAKEELALMERRLDAIIAFSRGVQEEKKDISWYKRLRIDELRKGIDERLGSLKSSFQESTENVADEVDQYRGRFQEILKSHSNVLSRRKKQKNRIFGNPTMVSKRYQDSLNELKQTLGDIRKKKN